MKFEMDKKKIIKKNTEKFPKKGVKLVLDLLNLFSF